MKYRKKLLKDAVSYEGSRLWVLFLGECRVCGHRSAVLSLVAPDDIGMIPTKICFECEGYTVRVEKILGIYEKFPEGLL